MDLEGQTLEGTYQLTRLVGEGGMGAVYEATHARLAGRYAIKVLLRELSDSPEARACFDREARVTSLLQHPNVVQVIDHNTTADGTSYLVMEYLSGESLAQRLARDGRLATPAVVDIVEQIAAGLAAAHGHGIVHRDLKPDNVFLVPVEGRATALVKLLDFGISKCKEWREPSDETICGTPEYMAPEQAEGRAHDVDSSSDQYALAVIAHELLTGENPFAADGIAAVLERVSGGLVPRTGVSATLDAVLARALSRCNRDRFPSVSAFADAFRAAATTEPLPAVGARRSRQRGGRVRLGFAAAAIVCASFLGTGAANRTPGPVAAGVETAVAAAAVGAGANTAVAAPAAAPADVAPAVTAEPAAEAAPALETPEVRAPIRPLRRVRIAGNARDDRPALTIPTATRTRTVPATLAPDEDATMAPSDL